MRCSLSSGGLAGTILKSGANRPIAKLKFIRTVKQWQLYEIHWYEATEIGRKEYKIKRFL